MRRLLVLFFAIGAAPLLSPASQTQPHRQTQESRWLWVKDYYSGLGVAGAWVDIAPGGKCLGRTKFTDVTWTAHYVTDGAGRVLVRDLPKKLSCRVTVGERQLNVFSGGFGCRGQNKVQNKLPSWIQLRPCISTIFTMPEADQNRTAPEHWWDTDDPTLFRSYIQDPDTAELISDVKVTALPSGITTTSDANGLFTLEVPASYRKGKFPAMATQTLVFSKPGYKTFQYRQLVLQPGVVHMDVFLPKGSGTLVRTNGSMYPENPYDDEFAAYPGRAPEHPPAGRGEIISFEIVPYTYDGGWININCRKGATAAKAVLKARNLKAASIGWIPTGTEMAEYGQSLPMKKVATSSDGDTWEATLSDIGSTNFVAGGTDKEGKDVHTIDLGNVGCD